MLGKRAGMSLQGLGSGVVATHVKGSLLLSLSWQHPRESDETLRKLIPSVGCTWPRVPSLHAKTSLEHPSSCLGSISHLEAQLWGLRHSPRTSLTF